MANDRTLALESNLGMETDTFLFSILDARFGLGERDGEGEGLGESCAGPGSGNVEGWSRISREDGRDKSDWGSPDPEESVSSVFRRTYSESWYSRLGSLTTTYTLLCILPCKLLRKSLYISL